MVTLACFVNMSAPVWLAEPSPLTFPPHHGHSRGRNGLVPGMWTISKDTLAFEENPDGSRHLCCSQGFHLQVAKIAGLLAWHRECHGLGFATAERRIGGQFGLPADSTPCRDENKTRVPVEATEGAEGGGDVRSRAELCHVKFGQDVGEVRLLHQVEGPIWLLLDLHAE